MTVEELNNVKGRAWEDVDVSVPFRCFTTQIVQSAYMWCNSIESLLLVRCTLIAGLGHSIRVLGTSHCVLYLFYGRTVDRDVGSLGTAEAFVDLDQRSKADLQIVGLHMLSLVWQTSSYASTTPPLDSIAIFAPLSP